MTLNLEELTVTHLPELARFELRVENHTAELDYVLGDTTITFTHTGVPSALEGQGVGNKLVKTGLDYARANGLQIRSTCWFVTLYLKRHPEYLS